MGPDRAGAVLFFGGVGLAFGRVGNTANYLAGLGILLLIVGGVLNLAATVQGLRFMVVRRPFVW